MKPPFQNPFLTTNMCDDKMKQQINVEGVGLLNESQITNLINNAKKLRIENKVLKEELNALKEVSL